MSAYKGPRHRLTVRLPLRTYLALARAAGNRNKTMGDIIEEALDAWLR